MLSYQHAYHAGNFADVHKHVALHGLLRALAQKTSGITLVDTHAGRGLYRLNDAHSQKTGEFEHGIAPVWAARTRFATESLLSDWTACLAELQHGNRLGCYPGSPWWLARAQRAQDTLSLFERHPAEHDALLTQPGTKGRRIQRLQADGLAGLVKMLPVATPRVCVLIDPSYEIKSDYKSVAKTLKSVVAKARHAVVLIWYPLLGEKRHTTLLDAVRAAAIPKIWQSEIRLAPAGARGGAGAGMRGSGLLLVNPPWQLDATLQPAFETLAELFDRQARARSGWLAGE